MEARKSLYLRVEDLSRELAASAAKLDTVKSDLEEMKDNISDNVMPTISAYKEDAAHRLGMWAAGKLFWGLILAVCTVAGFFIQKILSSLPPKVP